MDQLAAYNVRQIASIPEDWEMKSVEDLLDYERPDRYIVENSDYSNKFGIPVLTANKGFILGYTTETHSVCADLPVIVFDDFTTDSKFVDFPFKVKSSAIKLLRTKHVRTSLKYMYELLQLIDYPVAEHRRYYISEVQKMRIPVPSFDEQAVVASALNDADALLEGLDRLIAKKQDIKQAAMQQLLTGRTRLPGFTGKWEIKQLGDHVRFLRNGTNSHAELSSSGHTKYIHYGNVHASKHSFISLDTLAFLPESKAASLEPLQEGDLVFVDASEDLSGVGKSVELNGIDDTRVVAGLHTIAARFSREVFADGFKGYLQFCPAFLHPIRRLAAGTKVLSTSRKHIEVIRMPLPPRSEQVAIAEVLSDMDSDISALEARRDKTWDLKRAMMQELLMGRTRLVNPEASDA